MALGETLHLAESHFPLCKMGGDGLVAEPLVSHTVVKFQQSHLSAPVGRSGKGLGETPEVRGRLGSLRPAALRFPALVLATPATCFCFLLPDLFSVEPSKKSVAGLGFFPEVPATSNK